jgi:hypothetical protein
MKDGVLSKTDRNLVEESGWGDEDHQPNEYPGYITHDKIDFEDGDVIEIYRHIEDMKSVDVFGKPLVDFAFIVDMTVHGMDMLIGVESVADMLELHTKLTPYTVFKRIQDELAQSDKN